jgi:hypothetical protein
MVVKLDDVAVVPRLAEGVGTGHSSNDSVVIDGDGQRQSGELLDVCHLWRGERISDRS